MSYTPTAGIITAIEYQGDGAFGGSDCTLLLTVQSEDQGLVHILLPPGAYVLNLHPFQVGERLAERYAAAYGNRYSCASPRARKLWETFTEECQREGLLWDMKDIIHDYKKKYACTQLEFQF